MMKDTKGGFFVPASALRFDGPGASPPVSAPGITSPWPALRAKLEELGAAYVDAVGRVESPDSGADLANGVAAALVVLVDVESFAATGLEVRSLVRAAMGNLIESELASRLESHRTAQRKAARQGPAEDHRG